MFDILSDVAFDAWPSVSFLNPLQDFGYALVVRFVVGVEKDFLLIQLGIIIMQGRECRARCSLV